MVFSRKNKTAEFESEALPHMEALYKTAAGLLGSPSLAEDLVQEVYLRAWRSYHSYQRGTNCRAWLFKILVNCIQDQRRRWVSDRSASEDPHELDSRPVSPPRLPNELSYSEILEAVDRMPLKHREVLMFSDVEGLSYKEIAEIVGVPLGTVMSRLSRARRSLRERLAGLPESYGARESEKRKGSA